MSAITTLEPRIDQLLPDRRQVRLLCAKQIDALAARDLRVQAVYSRVSPLAPQTVCEDGEMTHISSRLVREL